MQRVRVALAVASRVTLGFAGCALLLMTGVVAWAVFGRFVLNDTPAWGEQVALLLLGWLIMAAAAVGVREGTHMGFDSLREALPAPVQRVCQVLSDVVVTAFGAGMVFFAGELAEGVWDNTLPTTGLPSGVEYLPMVLAGILIVLFGLERLAAHAAGAPAPSETGVHPLVSDA